MSPFLLLQGTGRLRARLTMDGVLVRDLQLRPSSKFAFLLRPLPARAAQLDSYATSFRRRILRVIGTSKAKKRCASLTLRIDWHLPMHVGLWSILNACMKSVICGIL